MEKVVSIMLPLGRVNLGILHQAAASGQMRGSCDAPTPARAAAWNVYPVTLPLAGDIWCMRSPTIRIPLPSTKSKSNHPTPSTNRPTQLPSQHIPIIPAKVETAAFTSRQTASKWKTQTTTSMTASKMEQKIPRKTDQRESKKTPSTSTSTAPSPSAQPANPAAAPLRAKDTASPQSAPFQDDQHRLILFSTIYYKNNTPNHHQPLNSPEVHLLHVPQQILHPGPRFLPTRHNLRRRQNEARAPRIPQLDREDVVGIDHVLDVIHAAARRLVNRRADGSRLERGAKHGLHGGRGALGEGLVFGVLCGEGGA